MTNSTIGDIPRSTRIVELIGVDVEVADRNITLVVVSVTRRNCIGVVSLLVSAATGAMQRRAAERASEREKWIILNLSD